MLDLLTLMETQMQVPIGLCGMEADKIGHRVLWGIPLKSTQVLNTSINIISKNRAAVTTLVLSTAD